MTTKRLTCFGAESSAGKSKATAMCRKGESVDVDKLRSTCRKGESVSVRSTCRTASMLSLTCRKGESQGVMQAPLPTPSSSSLGRLHFRAFTLRQALTFRLSCTSSSHNLRPAICLGFTDSICYAQHQVPPIAAKRR